MGGYQCYARGACHLGHMRLLPFEPHHAPGPGPSQSLFKLACAPLASTSTACVAKGPSGDVPWDRGDPKREIGSPLLGTHVHVADPLWVSLNACPDDIGLHSPGFVVRFCHSFLVTLGDLQNV